MNNYDTVYVQLWADRIIFGDIINPFIIHRLSDKVIATRLGMFSDDIRKDQPKLFSLGSIAQCVCDNSIVWGSGCVSNDVKIKNGLKLDIRAVRGPKTKEKFISFGYLCPEVYCDPGVLAPFLFGLKSNPIYEWGLMLHTTDILKMDQDMIARLKQEFHFIDISDDPYLIMQELSKCEKVVSSSLHGIIISEAMGVTACYLRTYVRANDYKVHDYFLGSGRQVSDIKKYTVKKEDKSIDKSKVQFTKPGKFNISQFLDVAPFELVDKDIIQKAKDYYGGLML